MSILPADIWARIFANLRARLPVLHGGNLWDAMATLTLCLALETAREEVMQDEYIAALVARQRAAAEAVLVKWGTDNAERIVAWYDMSNLRSRWAIVSRGEVEEIVTRLAYRGVTGRFYWRVGMASPETLCCKYDVKDIQSGIIRRCENDMHVAIVDRFMKRLPGDAPSNEEEEDDDDQIDDHDDDSDDGFQDRLDCITEIIEQHYPFDPAKIPHRLESHMKEAGVDFEPVAECSYPECPLCKRQSIQKAGKDGIQSMNGV